MPAHMGGQAPPQPNGSRRNLTVSGVVFGIVAIALWSGVLVVEVDFGGHSTQSGAGASRGVVTAEPAGHGGAVVPGDPEPAAPSTKSATPPGPTPPTNPKCNAGDKHKWRPGKCAFDSSWLEPWTRYRPGGNWTLVDVGANKGYVIAGWLDVLQQDSKFSPHHLGIRLFNRTLTGVGLEDGFLPSHCGGCCECLDRPPGMASKNKASRIKVYGFEPGPANYRWLSSFFTDKELVTVRNAAAGAASSRVYFPANLPLGTEIGKVSSKPQDGFVPIDIVTLDEELEHVQWIDVLSTDAEGFDQEIAKGAKRFLEAGNVGVYQFEMYRPDDYKAVFARLQQWGYDCYFSTASRRDKSHPPKKPFFKVPMLVRITDCWEDEYQGYVGWVNGLCHNTRVEALNKIFAYLARKHHKGGSGNCDGKMIQKRKVRDFLRKYVVGARNGFRANRSEVGVSQLAHEAEVEKSPAEDGSAAVQAKAAASNGRPAADEE